MGKEKNQIKLVDELDDEDMVHIREIFYEEIVPKLIKRDARLGNLSCEFAGEKYKNWMIQFQSKGSDFDIVEFEYDEDGESIDLDL
jgi:hypothetical protein